MDKKTTRPIDLLPPQDVEFDEAWDPKVVQRTIDHRTAHGRTPTYLFLGKEELGMLRTFLVEAWGEESLGAESNKYYLGLEIIPVDRPKMARIGGRRTFKRVIKTSESHDYLDSHWKLRVD